MKDEDDDDDPIDFGDGTIYQPHEHLEPIPIPKEPLIEQLVPKSERFVEDFDRSWPRGPPPLVEPSPGVPIRQDGDSRVLFNASLNRLEPSNNRPAPASLQPRLMSRPEKPLVDNLTKLDASPPAQDRPLPPHLPASGQNGRMLPPHMTAPPPLPEMKPLASERAPIPQSSSSGRQPWGMQLEAERQPAPAQVQKKDSDQLSLAPFPHPAPSSKLPLRQSPGQDITSVSQSNTLSPAGTRVGPAPSSVISSSIPVDPQTAEMHNAAEKARLRRLGEEAERNAAADRARRKAKELEERLGLNSATKAKSSEVDTEAPSSLTSHNQGSAVTLAVRSKQTADMPQPGISSKSLVSSIAGLPPRPAGDARVGESSWRVRSAGEDSVPRDDANSRPPEIVHTYALKSSDWPDRVTAESFYEPSPTSQLSANAMQDQHPVLQVTSQVAPLPSKTPVTNTLSTEPAATVPADTEHLLLPKKESNFDSMLARIQAAMVQARAAPPPYSPTREPVLTEEIRDLSSPKFQGSKDSTAGAGVIIGPQVATPSRSGQPADISLPVSDAPREFFDVTQPLPPRSPPPAWRTYAVKLPRFKQPQSPISKSRLDAIEASLRPPPDGWLMSFEPPIDQLSKVTLSRADLLLPQLVSRRFPKFADTGPLVSISPRILVPFEKRAKKKINDVLRPQEVVVPTTAEESLFMTALASPGSRAPSPSRQMQPQGSQIFDDSRWKADPAKQSGATVDISIRQNQFPLKPSPVAREGKDEPTKTAGLGTRVPNRGRTPIEMKPGVRFMVSSELDGDSLLDEVNKMSLESLGEGDEKGDESNREGGRKTPGTGTEVTSSRYFRERSLI